MTSVATAAAAGGAAATGAASGEAVAAVAPKAVTPTIRTRSGAELRLVAPGELHSFIQ